jgi:hypothetical protein
MKIYIDGWFIPLVKQPYTFFDNIDSIPNDCDIIGITFYNNFFHQHAETIQKLLPKTKKLLINISEPTEGLMSLRKFLKIIEHPNIYVFGDAVLNYPAVNWETIVSWFIESENFYVSRPWANDLLQQLTPWQQKNAKKSFDCLLGTKKPNRDFVANAYQNSILNGSFEFTYYRMHGNFKDMHIPNGLGPIDQNHNSTYAGQLVNISWMIPVDVYNSSWYSIVTETTQYNYQNQYTEKVAKPIVAGRPFIVFAGQYYLQNLHKLGFKTFSSVINESYDLVENSNDRWQQTWQQVEWLCNQDPHQVYQTLEPILEHNRRHFIETDWLSAIRKHL